MLAGDGLNQRAGNSGLCVTGASLWVSFVLVFSSGKMKIDGTPTFHYPLTCNGEQNTCQAALKSLGEEE